MDEHLAELAEPYSHTVHLPMDIFKFVLLMTHDFFCGKTFVVLDSLPGKQHNLLHQSD